MKIEIDGRVYVMGEELGKAIVGLQSSLPKPRRVSRSPTKHARK